MAHDENEKALAQDLNKELGAQLRDLGLGWLIERAVGGGAGVIMFLWGLVRSRIDKMRELALADLRSKYKDQAIQSLGQQVGGAFSSEDCWAFVHRVGGTVWVQHVYVTSTEGLSLMVFWHPDPKFKLEKDVIRAYRASNMCTVDTMQPSFRPAP